MFSITDGKYGELVLEAAPIFVLVLDVEGIIRHVGSYFERLTGHRLDEVRGKDWFEGFVPERDRQRVRSWFRRECEEDRAGRQVYPIVTRAGEEIEVEWTHELLRDQEGRPSGLLAIGHDVTERVRAERMARALEQRQRSILDGMFSFVAVLDLAGNILDVNRTPLESAGIRREDILGKPFADQYWLSHSEAERRKLLSVYERAKRGEIVREEFRVRLGKDRFADFDAVFGPLRTAGGGIDAVIASGVNVSERKTAERTAQAAQDALRKSEQRLADAHRLAHIGAWELDLQTGANWWSDEQYRLHGLPGGAPVTQEQFLTCIHPDDRANFDAAFQRALEQGSAAHEFRIVRPDGQVRNIHGLARTVYEEGGRPIAVMGTNQDITARKRAEEALRDGEERLRQALEASGQGTWELDLRTPTTSYSADMARVLGYSPGELLDEDIARFSERVHPEDRTAMWGTYQAYILGTIDHHEVEFRVRTRAGDWKWILSTGRIVERDAAGAPIRVIGTYRDIDVRKQAELRVSAALREKEILLREIHHRVKNNLQIISSLLHFQAKKAGSPDTLEAFADLRRRLLAMSLVHEKLYESSGLALVDFGDYVLSLVGALASSFASRGALRIDLPERRVALPSEAALPAGMILCELVTNIYKYAWPGAAGAARLGLEIEADEVVLLVADDGVGLPRGLDLRTAGSFGWQLVRTLVAQLGGRFEVCSDAGTVVRVKFPLPGGPGEPAGVVG